MRNRTRPLAGRAAYEDVKSIVRSMAAAHCVRCQTRRECCGERTGWSWHGVPITTNGANANADSCINLPVKPCTLETHPVRGAVAIQEKCEISLIGDIARLHGNFS